MRGKLFISSAVLALIAGELALPGSASAQAADQAESTSAQIGEIVVTATRRAEKLQNVPISVQAIGSEQLRAQGITDFSQLVAALPALRAGGRGPGQNSVSIRGMSLSQIQLTAASVAGPNPNVAMYIDDASVAIGGRNLDVYVSDMERIEVLEGPQGSLFGASAQAGAIRYITAKPNLSKFGAGMNLGAAATFSHEASYSANGYINLPIIEDKLAIRATVFVDRQGGYIDNVNSTHQMPLVGYNQNGTIAFCLPGAPAAVCGAATAAKPAAVRPIINNAAFAKNDFNPASYAGGRISMKWAPAPDWTVVVQDMFQTLTTDGTFQYDPTLGDLKVDRFSPDHMRDRFNQVQWNVEGKVGPLNLIYAGSYLTRRVNQQIDYTRYADVGPYMPYYICKYPGYATCATPQSTYIDNIKNTRISQELRFNTPSNLPLRLQAGVYYDNAKLYQTNQFHYEGAIAQGFQGQPPGGTFQVDPSVRPAGSVYFNDALRSDSQFAVFGEGNWDITKSLTLTAGGRYFYQKINLQGSTNCGSYDFSVTPAVPLATQPNGHVCTSGNYAVSLAGKAPAHETGFKPRVTLSWKPTNDVLLYATYSEGFRPGGFNRRGGSGRGFTIPFTYGSDSVKNYEVGWKTQWANRTVQLNGSAYWVEWSNIPIAIYSPSISSSTFTVNGPSARIQGITNDLTWRPTRQWTLVGNLTYNKTQLTSYGQTPAAFQPTSCPVTGTPLTFDCLGTPLALAPKWQGNFRARYELENGSGVTFHVQAMVQFVGSSRTQTIVARNFELPSYATADASIGARKDQWTFDVYLNNLTDKRALTYIGYDDNRALNSTIRPRTVGMRFGWNY